MGAVLCAMVWILTGAEFLAAQTAPVIAPAISLSSPAKNVWETDQPSIPLQGSVTVAGSVSNVVWVNQLGNRGTGTWASTGDGKANWTVANVPLRMGINHISVTIVDSNGHSSSLHLVINRKLPAGASPEPQLPIRSGTYKNQPITYQVWNGMPVIEGDILLGPASVSPAALAQPAAAATGESSQAAGVKPGGIQPAGLAISYTNQLWPLVGSVYQVPYIITGSGDTTNVTTAINSFNTNFAGLIQFVAHGSETNFVNIVDSLGGNGEGFSNVGMVGGEQTLSCGESCSVATWLHEWDIPLACITSTSGRIAGATSR